MKPFSIVLPVKDEVDLLELSLPSAIRLHPDEILLVTDVGAKLVQDAALRICRKWVYTGLRILEVERNPNWNFFQAWVRRAGYLAARYDTILTFDVDNILTPAIMEGLPLIGKDNVAFVTLDKSASRKRGLMNAVRKASIGLRANMKLRSVRARLGANTKTPFPGLYWLYRPYYLEIVPEEEIRKIYNGEDTFVNDKFERGNKYKHIHIYKTGSYMLAVENEELPWRQYEYGLWLGASGRPVRMSLLQAVMRVYPNLLIGYFAGRKLPDSMKQTIRGTSYLEFTTLLGPRLAKDFGKLGFRKMNPIWRVRYYLDWRKRHVAVQSGGYTGDFKKIRLEIDHQIASTSVDFSKSRFECPTVAYLYQLVRAQKPKTVIELGVQRGCSTYAILLALHANGFGELHSIDNVPDIFFGRLVAPVVPGHLKNRWHYHEGDSRIVLPKLLNELGTVDMAFHDADHTKNGQFAELQNLWNHGAKILVVDYTDDNFKSYLNDMRPTPEASRDGIMFRQSFPYGVFFRGTFK